jgi:hypothetical protein
LDASVVVQDVESSDSVEFEVLVVGFCVEFGGPTVPDPGDPGGGFERGGLVFVLDDRTHVVRIIAPGEHSPNITLGFRGLEVLLRGWDIGEPRGGGFAGALEPSLGVEQFFVLQSDCVDTCKRQRALGFDCREAVGGLELGKGDQGGTKMPKVFGAFMLPCRFSPAEDSREQKRKYDDACDQSDEAIEPRDAGALGLGGVELLG